MSTKRADGLPVCGRRDAIGSCTRIKGHDPGCSDFMRDMEAPRPLAANQINAVCQQGLVGNVTTPLPPPSPSSLIRTRLAELDAIRSNYLGYLQCRISESDWHGCWDASVNISETECEMAGLRFALTAMEGA